MNEEERSLYEGAWRVYTPCEGCGGWDEHWEIVNGPRLNGRHNHLRSCTRTMFVLESSND